MGRAIATGPGLVQVDYALQKNTRLASISTPFLLIPDHLAVAADLA